MRDRQHGAGEVREKSLPRGRVYRITDRALQRVGHRLFVRQDSGVADRDSEFVRCLGRHGGERFCLAAAADHADCKPAPRDQQRPDR